MQRAVAPPFLLYRNSTGTYSSVRVRETRTMIVTSLCFVGSSEFLWTNTDLVILRHSFSTECISMSSQPPLIVVAVVRQTLICSFCLPPQRSTTPVPIMLIWSLLTLAHLVAAGSLLRIARPIKALNIRDLVVARQSSTGDMIPAQCGTDCDSINAELAQVSNLFV